MSRIHVFGVYVRERGPRDPRFVLHERPPIIALLFVVIGRRSKKNTLPRQNVCTKSQFYFFTFPKVHLAQKENDFVKVFSQAANGRIGNKLSLAF